MREKFGVKIPNSTKEDLLLDKINCDNKWHDYIQKESIALEKISTQKYHLTHYKIYKDYQKEPSCMIFDAKKEDLRRKSRDTVGGHIIYSTHLELHY